jgi:hypothetical protein
MKDLIVGCFNRFSVGALQPWANSIERCGFTGDKLVIVYGHEKNEEEAVKHFHNRSWLVKHMDTFTKLIVVCRFRDIADFLSQNEGKYRYVISTDAGDVVFQSNPSVFLEENMQGKEILVGSECIRYKDETSWGCKNLYQSFPIEAPYVVNHVIMNAGTIAATAQMAIPLFRRIFEMSMNSPVGNPDQAALNVCLRLYDADKTRFMDMADGWAMQLNTVANPDLLRVFGSSLTEREFYFRDGLGYVAGNVKAVIVHQYNHVPGLWEEMKRHYL